MVAVRLACEVISVQIIGLSEYWRGIGVYVFCFVLFVQGAPAKRDYIADCIEYWVHDPVSKPIHNVPSLTLIREVCGYHLIVRKAFIAQIIHKPEAFRLCVTQTKMTHSGHTQATFIQ